MDKPEKAKALHHATDKHYNCAQSVAVTYAAECGLSEEQAYKMAANFGSGMRHGSTCGAVTGALMVIGMLGKDSDAASRLMREFRNKNQHLDCASLLREAASNGEERKSHCDRMVLDAVALVEELLKES